MATTRGRQYLQRADDFIQQQIYKCEQRLQGRDYNEVSRANRMTHNNMPQNGSSLPTGWTQEFDSRSQRWYYLERATGRSQWESPGSPRSHRHSFNQTQHQSRASTAADEHLARRLQEEENSRGRFSGQQPQSQPQPGHLGVPQSHRPTSTSPHPSPNGRLPPGVHVDMRTGQIQTNMFPPDHPMNARY